MPLSAAIRAYLVPAPLRAARTAPPASSLDAAPPAVATAQLAWARPPPAKAPREAKGCCAPVKARPRPEPRRKRQQRVAREQRRQRLPERLAQHRSRTESERGREPLPRTPARQRLQRPCLRPPALRVAPRGACTSLPFAPERARERGARLREQAFTPDAPSPSAATPKRALRSAGGRQGVALLPLHCAGQPRRACARRPPSDQQDASVCGSVRRFIILCCASQDSARRAAARGLSAATASSLPGGARRTRAASLPAAGSANGGAKAPPRACDGTCNLLPRARSCLARVCSSRARPTREARVRGATTPSMRPTALPGGGLRPPLARCSPPRGESSRTKARLPSQAPRGPRCNSPSRDQATAPGRWVRGRWAAVRG